MIVIIDTLDNRLILHVDMDAFFASVEQKDNPSLKGKPVIVGGTGERCVVSTCSYEARKYGVHSAMPVFVARQKCPMGIFLPVRYNRYKEISNEIFNILRYVTPLVEPLSIDEAFLDLSESDFDDGLEAAKYIKDRVFKELGLTLSVGISYNKGLAKLASDWNKPNGIKIISRDDVPEILLPLPISKIFGVGKKSVHRLNNIGIFTVKDLYDLPLDFFLEYMGNKHGRDIYERIRGIDSRSVETYRDRKSIGKERTLINNTNNKSDLLNYLKLFSQEIGEILNKKSMKCKTIVLKYKTKDFETHTRSKTLVYYTSDSEAIFNTAKEILQQESIPDIRLIGLTVSSLKDGEAEQLTLF